jgi:hypothetical protein
MPNPNTAAAASFQNADAYERIMGRWSRRLAPQLIRFGGLSDGDRVLDVGCGTGSLTFALPNSQRCGVSLASLMSLRGARHDAFRSLRDGHAQIPRKVRADRLLSRMEFSSFDDYWLPFTRGEGSPGQFVANLSAATRAKLAEPVRQGYLSGQPDGPRSFACVAWACRGTVPA